MNIFKKFKAYLRFREAVKKANEAHLINGQRYYVLPTDDGKLVIMDRKNFRGLRRKGYLARNISIATLANSCIYHTPDNRGMGGVPEQFLKEKFNDYIKYLDR